MAHTESDNETMWSRTCWSEKQRKLQPGKGRLCASFCSKHQLVKGWLSAKLPVGAFQVLLQGCRGLLKPGGLKSQELS